MNRVRRALHRSAALAFVLFSATFFSLSAAGVTQPLVADAYNCSPGWFFQQQDVFNGSGHGWLGTCEGLGTALAYTGEDWGGTTLSWQYLHLRMWECGVQLYNSTYETYNTRSISLNSGWWLNPCGVQSDSSSGEGVNGQFSWWWYLRY